MAEDTLAMEVELVSVVESLSISLVYVGCLFEYFP